jgi:hypothetical protein
MPMRGVEGSAHRRNAACFFEPRASRIQRMQKKHGPQAVQHEVKMKAAWSSG